jgi:hypothetical protein
MNHYASRYIELMEKVAVNLDDLPAPLVSIIEKFEKAVISWQQADEETKEPLLSVLVKTDAIISANIFQLYKESFETKTIDKVKLMALKAKALQVKWKLKQT